MRIELTNKTHWRSDHIRAFLVKGMQAERPDLCKRGAPPMHITITYRRPTRPGFILNNHSSGYAYLHSRTMRVRLPRETPDKVDFAHVITHELAHTRGLTHDRMNSCATYGRVGRWRELYAWGETLPLEKEGVKPKVKGAPDKKLAHAEALLKAAKTREKRSTTLRKKWEAKVKYYTKRAVKGETCAANEIQ